MLGPLRYPSFFLSFFFFLDLLMWLLSGGEYMKIKKCMGSRAAKVPQHWEGHFVPCIQLSKPKSTMRLPVPAYRSRKPNAHFPMWSIGNLKSDRRSQLSQVRANCAPGTVFALKVSIKDHCFMGNSSARECKEALANRVVFFGNKHIQWAVGKGQYVTNEASKIYYIHFPCSGSRWLT